jgi:hypothetical protein
MTNHKPLYKTVYKLQMTNHKPMYKTVYKLQLTKNHTKFQEVKGRNYSDIMWALTEPGYI